LYSENERSHIHENKEDSPFICRFFLWAGCSALAALECFVVLPRFGADFFDAPYILVVEGLMLFFSLYFFFLAPRRLPAYYDENKISVYYHWGMKMSMPGIHFNNRNWTHIVTWTRNTMLSVMVGYPIVFAVLFKLMPNFEPVGALILTFIFAFTFIVPVYIAAKRYE